MLATTVNLPARRAPSPQIRARDTSLDGTTNCSAGINSTPNVDAGISGATHLGGQRCGDHEDRGDSTNYRKLAKHEIGPSRDDHGGGHAELAAGRGGIAQGARGCSPSVACVPSIPNAIPTRLRNSVVINPLSVSAAQSMSASLQKRTNSGRRVMSGLCQEEI